MTSGEGLSQRELLLEVREDVRDIKASVSAKADREDVRRLEQRLTDIDRDGSHGVRDLKKEVDDHDKRIELLERSASAEEAVDKYRKWFAMAVVSSIGLFVAIISVILSNYFTLH